MRYPTIQRRATRLVRVGGVRIGGGSPDSEIAPVVVQSMTNTATSDAAATVAQVRALAEAGAELVRVACPTAEDTAALGAIVDQSPVPIIADVHFHVDRALEAIAAGAAKVRLNPGNIARDDDVRRVIHAAGEAGAAIRIGVNEGSVLDRRDEARRREQLDRPLEELMADVLGGYLDLFEREGFENLVLSAKSHDAVTTVAANRLIAERWNYPLHLGVTHAGPPATAAIRSAAALGALLNDGIGETLRISYAGDPVREVRDAVELLCSLRLRERKGVELIACPTCGRLQMDLQPVVDELAEKLAAFADARPITVAVMGCVVNGPGEAASADVAVCAGKGKAALYVHGEHARNVTPGEIVPTVLAEVRNLARES